MPDETEPPSGDGRGAPGSPPPPPTPERVIPSQPSTSESFRSSSHLSQLLGSPTGSEVSSYPTLDRETHLSPPRTPPPNGPAEDEVAEVTDTDGIPCARGSPADSECKHDGGSRAASPTGCGVMNPIPQSYQATCPRSSKGLEAGVWSEPTSATDSTSQGLPPIDESLNNAFTNNLISDCNTVAVRIARDPISGADIASGNERSVSFRESPSSDLPDTATADGDAPAESFGFAFLPHGIPTPPHLPNNRNVPPFMLPPPAPRSPAKCAEGDAAPDSGSPPPCAGDTANETSSNSSPAGSWSIDPG